MSYSSSRPERADKQRRTVGSCKQDFPQEGLKVVLMLCPKRMTIASLMAIATMLAYSQPSGAQNNTRDGALLGGATGAAIGAIIGNNKNDQTAEGALIGGAIGIVTGGVIGHHRDRVAAEQQRQAWGPYYPYHPPQHSYYAYPAPRTYYHPGYQPQCIGPGQPTIVYGAPVVTRQGVYQSPVRTHSGAFKQPVTLADVMQLSRAGVSDQVIVARIQANGMAQAVSIEDVIALNKEGVSDYVISAMQGNGVVHFEQEPASEPDPHTHVVRRSPGLMQVPPMRSQRKGF